MASSPSDPKNIGLKNISPNNILSRRPRMDSVKPSLFKDVANRDGEIPKTFLKKRTQAERIFARFRGIERLHALLEAAGRPLRMSTIYRWNYPRGKNSGTGGIIPGRVIPSILLAARLDGIFLTPEDLDPREL